MHETNVIKVLFSDFVSTEGLPKILDFGYFVLIWCKLIKKQETLKETCKELFIWTELPIVWLIIGSDNIFNIEVNGA